MNMDSPQMIHNTSLQRLQIVEKRIVRVLELAGGVMDELANPAGLRKDLLNNHCGEFMKLIKDIQVILREEIKSVSEYGRLRSATTMRGYQVKSLVRNWSMLPPY